MGKTTHVKRMGKIDWNGPYASEKYSWKCLGCGKVFGSRNEANKCYNNHEEQKRIAKLRPNPLPEGFKWVKMSIFHPGIYYENIPTHCCEKCYYSDWPDEPSKRGKICKKHGIDLVFELETKIRCLTLEQIEEVKELNHKHKDFIQKYNKRWGKGRN